MATLWSSGYPDLATMLADAQASGINEAVIEEGDHAVSAPLVITQHRLHLHSQGARILMDDPTQPAIVLSGCHRTRIDGLLDLRGRAKKTGGYALRLENGCYRCVVEDVVIQYAWNGIEVVDSTANALRNIELRHIAGLTGLWFHGTPAVGCYGLTVYDFQGDNPPVGGHGTPRGWAPGMTVNLHDILFCASGMFSVVTAGVTGSTAPTIPGCDGPGMFADVVTDGTADLRFIGGLTSWIVQDSHAHSLRLVCTQSLRGWVGDAMRDTLNTGTSRPLFHDGLMVECDHQMSIGVDLSGGMNADFVNAWIGSCLAGHGAHVKAGFGGELTIRGSRLVGSALKGIKIDGGSRIIAAENIVNSNAGGTISSAVLGPTVIIKDNVT